MKVTIPNSQAAYALVVDDHPLVGRGVAEYLKAQKLLDDAVVASTVADARAVIDEKGAPAVLLVDFWLQDGATDQFIKLMRSRWVDTKVLVMTGDDNPAIVTKIVACGAHGFLHKNEPPRAFSEAIAQVLNGQLWYPQKPLAQLPAASAGHTAQQGARSVSVTPADLGLTLRQGQILSMLLQALPNRRIAEVLSVSENTVKEHVTAVLTKLAVANRVELITKLRGVTLTEGRFE